jgi:hypothetical protein
MAAAILRHLVTFGIVSRVASAVCVLLAGTWLLAPHILLNLWQIENSDVAVLLSRRSAALFLGLGLILWLSRNAPKSTARDAIASGMSMACAGLAVLGCYEFASGHAGPGIWLAVAVEAPLAAAFISARAGA